MQSFILAASPSCTADDPVLTIANLVFLDGSHLSGGKDVHGLGQHVALLS